MQPPEVSACLEIPIPGYLVKEGRLGAYEVPELG